MKISAVVTSCNEGHLLERCLSSLVFCDEIIVVDLESTDNTRTIAEKLGAKYLRHKLVPVVEIIHEWIQDKTKNDWILITDPDEVCSELLGKSIIELIPCLQDNIGAIKVPMKNYFGKRQLKGTQWGGDLARIYVVHRQRFFFTKNVHRGRHLKKGKQFYYLPSKKDAFVHHYWITDKKQLKRKHMRYLENEGTSQYDSGKRTNRFKFIWLYFKSFINSFITRKGFKDGFLGLYLSLFWAKYQALADLKLFKYQNRMLKVKVTNHTK